MDLIHVEGKPSQSLMGVNGTIIGIYLKCFKHWYREFPVSHNLRLDFDFNGRTLYLATVGGKHWYIVMKPMRNRDIEPNPGPGTAMSKARAAHLNKFILGRLMQNSLLHLGFSLYNYVGRCSNELTMRDFGELQDQIMSNWETHMITDDVDEYWLRHVPTFHCIVIGNNLPVGIVI
jgi:hypothetical protein